MLFEHLILCNQDSETLRTSLINNYSNQDFVTKVTSSELHAFYQQIDRPSTAKGAFSMFPRWPNTISVTISAVPKA